MHRLRRANSVPRMGTLASALMEGATSVGLPVAGSTPRVHAELDFGEFLARQAAFVQVRCCAHRVSGSRPCHDHAQDAYYSVSNDHWPWEDECLLPCSTCMSPEPLVILRPCG